MTIKIWPISAFSDNYIWAIVQADQAVVVDPGDAAPVLAYLRDQGLTLTNILLTHHHADHVGGVAELVQHSGATVYGPPGPTIPCRNVELRQGDHINLGIFGQFTVLEVPGHTLDHIAYFGQVDERNVLFCGDTLFATGCGRLFEGNSRQMQQSLDKFRKLPHNTSVYCAHEYTLGNIRWARTVDPHNPDLEQWQREAETLRNNNQATVPTSLEHELKTNPFMRTDEPVVITAAEQHVGHSLDHPENVLEVLREWKNQF
ncbi:hydroxyacylglutathione hydrolase [Advenella sp. FME57]|uniref:hydroxyacylglutathione hydrolase n=1 Tax=Advenella sp. FME57 TaxID=2742604 RepID=UPI00186814DD|nr:hydroxyacylglutathione hydrolase [Advenella sp. FME57]